MDNITLQQTTENDAITIKFKECLDLFEQEAFSNGIPRMCEIHYAFGNTDGDHHNCLGCNFADCTRMIKNYLEKYQSHDSIRESFSLYILNLYLITERMNTVMDIVSIPERYKEKYFKVFQQIRKWANFIKHPKSFILTHHPEYDYQNSGIEYTNNFDVTIDETFVERYYKGVRDHDKQKKINKELYDQLKQKKNIIVIFPDIAIFTKKLCFSMNKFIELITKNEVYIDILNDEATISDYFENQ